MFCRFGATKPSNGWIYLTSHTKCKLGIEESVTDCYNDASEKGFYDVHQTDNTFCNSNDAMGVICKV